MKKNLYILLLVAFGSLNVNAQKATLSLKAGSQANSLIVEMTPVGGTLTGRVTNVSFCIGIPNTVPGTPTVSLLNNLMSSLLVFSDSQTWPSQGDGYKYTFFTFNEATLTTPSQTYPAGTPVNVAEIKFDNTTINAATIRLAHLPNGEGDANAPQYAFYWEQLGTDKTNYPAMFYGAGVSNNAAGYGAYSFLPFGTVIPVKFLGFTATRKDNDALLNWSVENESGITDRYEIERSLNGTDFTKFATVAPKNNGSSSNIYNLTDANLTGLRSSGIIYYRVKQVDKDGKYIYTEIRSVRLDGKGIVIGVYPNPVKDVANVTMDLLDASKVMITVTDATGKEIQKVSLQAVKGFNSQTVNMRNLAAGTYMFKVNAGEEVKTISVIKAQ